MPFLCFGKSVSLKGSHGSSSLAYQGQWSPVLVPNKRHEVTFSVWAIDTASERNKFLALAEMENSLLISL
jgi:hypothetical protein